MVVSIYTLPPTPPHPTPKWQNYLHLWYQVLEMLYQLPPECCGGHLETSQTLLVDTERLLEDQQSKKQSLLCFVRACTACV